MNNEENTNLYLTWIASKKNCFILQTAEDKSEFSSDSESGGIQIKESGSFRTVPSLHELYMAEKQVKLKTD